MRKLTLSIGAALLATTGVAIAAPQIATPDMTRAQAQAKAAERFAKMDVNGDGKLDQADRAARQAQRFDRLDADNNGAVSREEFAAKASERRQGAQAARQTGDGAERMHRRGGHRMGMGKGMGMGRARMADANNDGAISQAEFTAGALAMFDRMDADRNGTVTQAERQAARAAMKAQWQQRRAAATAQGN